MFLIRQQPFRMGKNEKEGVSGQINAGCRNGQRFLSFDFVASIMVIEGLANGPF